MNKENRAVWEKMWPKDVLKAFDALAAADPEILRLVEEIPVERVWARKGLTLPQRSLITLSSQIALQRWDQVELHMKSYLHMGGTREELREVCIHLSIYCGFPVMLRALSVLREIK